MANHDTVVVSEIANGHISNEQMQSRKKTQNKETQ